jgi:hypothetical protein
LDVEKGMQALRIHLASDEDAQDGDGNAEI